MLMFVPLSLRFQITLVIKYLLFWFFFFFFELLVNKIKKQSTLGGKKQLKQYGALKFSNSTTLLKYTYSYF